MNCPEVQTQLSEFLEKSLDAIRMKSIETHLNSCPVCRNEATGLSDCVRQVAELPIIELPVGFAQRVMAHVREIEVEPRGWQRFIAAFRATVPIQAAAVVMIAVLAVLLYQKETQIRESDPGQRTTVPLALPIEQKTNFVIETARSNARSPSSAEEIKRETGRPSVAERSPAPARQEQASDSASMKDQATLPLPGTKTAKPSESRIAPSRRPAIQAQEVATGRGSFRPSADAFGFGATIGALSQAPFRNAPFAPAERAFSPLSEPTADIEFIVRRRPFERRDQQKEEASSDSPVKRSEADAAIATAVAKRAVPAPAPPASSIVEMRWFAVPADRYEQFRKELAAEAHIDSERSMSGMDKEFSSRSSRELLIKVIILPSER
jgi:hypothetical protein